MKNSKEKKEKPSINLRSLFSNNKFVFVFSLIIAFGLWLWVSVEKSPVVENVIVSVPVQIDLENSVPEQLGLKIFGDKTYTVDVTVSGKKFIVSSLTADDIKVTAQTNYVDSSGNKSLLLKASQNSSKDFEIVSLSQNYISVFFDTYKEAEFAVEPNIVNPSVIDGCFLGNIVFSKSTVTVSGPSSEVNRITGVAATATINEQLSSTTTVTPVIELLGAQKSELSNVTVDTGDNGITMTIPVLKEVTLPTTVTLKNAPANYLASSINKTVYPSTIKVGIPVEKIDTIKEISVGTVDFNDIDAGNNVFTFKAQDIPDYFVTDTAKSFKVNVYISDVTSAVFAVPMQNVTVNPKEGYNATVNTKVIQNVKILGPESVISTLTSDSFVVEIDLSNIDAEEGTVNVPVKIVIKDNTSCWANGSYTANVTLTKA